MVLPVDSYKTKQNNESKRKKNAVLFTNFLSDKRNCAFQEYEM